MNNLIPFAGLIVAFLSLLYTKQRTNSLERQMTLVRLNSCFQILDSARDNYKWSEGYFSIAKRKIAGHIIYGNEIALFVKGDDKNIPENGSTLVLKRLLKRLLLVEKPSKLTYRNRRELERLLKDI